MRILHSQDASLCDCTLHLLKRTHPTRPARPRHVSPSAGLEDSNGSITDTPITHQHAASSKKHDVHRKISGPTRLTIYQMQVHSSAVILSFTCTPPGNHSFVPYQYLTLNHPETSSMQVHTHLALFWAARRPSSLSSLQSLSSVAPIRDLCLTEGRMEDAGTLPKTLFLDDMSKHHTSIQI
jgi:hypothetical protein